MYIYSFITYLVNGHGFGIHKNYQSQYKKNKKKSRIATSKPLNLTSTGNIRVENPDFLVESGSVLYHKVGSGSVF